MPPKLSPLQHRKACHTDGIWAVSWLKGEGEGADKHLLTGSADETVKRWRVDGEGALHEEHCYKHEGLELGVVSVATAPNGLMAACSMRSQVLVFNATTFVAQITAGPGAVWGTAFEPGDAPRHLATAAGAAAGISLWRIDEPGIVEKPVAEYSLQKPMVRNNPRRCARRFRALHVHAPLSVQSSPLRISEHAAACSARSTNSTPLRPGELGTYFSRERRRQRAPWHSPQAGDLGLAARFTQSVCFSPSGTRVACGSMDGNVAVFDTETKQLLRHLEARHPILPAPFAPLCLNHVVRIRSSRRDLTSLPPAVAVASVACSPPSFSHERTAAWGAQTLSRRSLTPWTTRVLSL